MSDEQEKIDRLIDLAKKTGRVFVASDCSDALRSTFAAFGIKVIENRFLEAGTILAVDQFAIPTLGIWSCEDTE